MRPRDDNKIEAIFEATIQLINEIGISDASISKIAKKANVSAATIYIYFENKEDMLGKTYLKAKNLMSTKIFQGLDETTSIRDQFERLTRKFVEFILANKDYFMFMEQISNSPLLESWCLEDTTSLYKPIFDLFERGKLDNVFKQEDINLLITYSVFPIAQLAKEQLKGEFTFDSQKLDTAIQMSWDAIRL